MLIQLGGYLKPQHALPHQLIVFPLSRQLAASGLPEGSLAVALVVIVLARVAGAIGVRGSALAVALFNLPATSVRVGIGAVQVPRPTYSPSLRHDYLRCSLRSPN